MSNALERTVPMVPGEIVGPDDPIEINGGRPVLTVRVENTGDRPVQVGSHYHFAEANPALAFDRAAAHGHRLDVPAGTAVRFEPGIIVDVDLVPFVGSRIVPGLRGAVGGPLDAATASTATETTATETTATETTATGSKTVDPSGAKGDA